MKLLGEYYSETSGKVLRFIHEFSNRKVMKQQNGMDSYNEVLEAPKELNDNVAVVPHSVRLYWIFFLLTYVFINIISALPSTC